MWLWGIENLGMLFGGAAHVLQGVLIREPVGSWGSDTLESVRTGGLIGIRWRWSWLNGLMRGYFEVETCRLHPWCSKNEEVLDRTAKRILTSTGTVTCKVGLAPLSLKKILSTNHIRYFWR